MRGYVRGGLCLLASTTYAAAASYPGLWWLGLVSLAPLVVALRAAASGWQVLLLSWLAFALAILLACSWIAPAFDHFAAFPGVGLAAWAAFAIFDSLRIGLACTAWWLLRVPPGPSALVFGALLVAADSLWPRLLPWPVGIVLATSDPLVQTAALGGANSLTFIVAVFGCAVGEGISWGWRTVHARRGWFAGYALGLLLCAAWGLWRLGEGRGDVGSAVWVGIVQAGRHPLATPNDQQRAVDRHVDLTHELLRHKSVDLVIWGETAVTRPTDERDWARGLRQRMRRLPDVPILLGANLVRTSDAGPNQFFNSAVLLSPSGPPCSSCRYDKQLLVPGAERLDRDSLFGAWLPRGGRYVAGNHTGAIVVAGHPVAAFVCYEALHAEYVRELVVSTKAELLVNLTSDTWLGETLGPAQHLRLAKLRAVEHGKTMLRVADTGLSAVIDPFGRELQSTALNESRVLTARVGWSQASTLYSKLGEAPWLILGAVASAWALGRRLRERPGTWKLLRSRRFAERKGSC
jgi:apolipoprotein N-acyltransferase